MNGVRRFFAAAKPSFPSGSELSPSSPTQSDDPDDSYTPSATSSVSPEPPTLSTGIQLQANTPLLVLRQEDPITLIALENQQTRVNGVSSSLESPPNPKSRLTSEDLPGEQGSDLRSTHRMRSLSTTQSISSFFPEQLRRRMDIRDDLLLSLQTSEVIVDSRDYETLTIEEAETLKEEQRYLVSRTDAARKKLNLELKLRDVSHNLQKLNGSKAKTESAYKRDSVNNKLDVVNAELVRTLEQLLRVDRRLLQHQSAILSQSVHSLERQLSPEHLNQISNLNSTKDLPLSPKSPALTFYSPTSTPTRSKFEGAHLFAGHAQSSLPTSSRHNYNTHRIQEMEAKLRAVDEAKKLVETRLVALEEEYQQLRQQNINLEKSYELQLSRAQNTIHDLEDKLGKSLDALQVREEWERDKREWNDERAQLESHLAQRDLERKENERNWHIDRQSLEDSVRHQREMISALERNVDDLSAIRMEKEKLDQLVLQKDDELLRLNEIMGRDEASWQAEKVRLEDELKQARNAMDKSHISDEVANGTLTELREILEELVDLHEIPHDYQDNAVLSLLSSVRNHLTSLSVNMKDAMEDKAVLEDQLRNYESNLRKGSENQERLRRELEEFQQTQRGTMTTVRRELKPRTKEVPEDSPSPDTLSAEYSKIVEQLKGLWTILPSVEARAPRIPKNGPISPQSSTMAFSLSDLDVRTLKTLYDPKQGFVSPYVDGQFNIEKFVRMVHTLVNDDRALIERLLRFAQSHDLLRNNAERAQKLAQESSKGLEMYQIQVRSLEERNMMLSHKQLTMMDEISGLQQSLEILTNERDDLTIKTTEQALVVQRLTNVLSGRDRARVEESPMATKANLLAKYFTEIQTKLQEAQDEVKQLRSVETSQRVALLDELNSLQQENNQLREQLRSQR